MKLIARTYKEIQETLRIQVECDKAAKECAEEFEAMNLRKYRDEHPTENEANRIHAGAPCDDPEVVK